MQLHNLRHAMDLLQGKFQQSGLRQVFKSWQQWACRRRRLQRSVAAKLQGRYLGEVLAGWKQFAQWEKLGRSNQVAALTHFTQRTVQQVE